MEVKELRLQTGLSQSKFAKMFDVPVATLKDWEQERRNPPVYVINMMRTILQYKGMLISPDYVEACDARRKSVENAMAIMLSATSGPDELFLEVLDSYIFGEITLEAMFLSTNITFGIKNFWKSLKYKKCLQNCWD